MELERVFSAPSEEEPKKEPDNYPAEYRNRSKNPDYGTEK
jgi:hypothetical protein